MPLHPESSHDDRDSPDAIPWLVVLENRGQDPTSRLLPLHVSSILPACRISLWPGQVEYIPLKRPASRRGRQVFIMSTVSFQFQSANGTAAPKFDLDISDISDIDALRRAIGANFGVVQPEGKSVLSISCHSSITIKV